MSTNINITLAGQLSARVSAVQQSTRENDKNEKEAKKATNKAKPQAPATAAEEEKRAVWEPEETRPYYNPLHQDDGLLAVWVLITQNDSTYKYYISGATANNWTLLYERDKSPGGGGGGYFFGDNFASIISGNPFNIPPKLWSGDDVPNGFTTSGYWNGKVSGSPTGSAPWNGKWYTSWVYFNHINHPFYGACSAWVDDLGTSSGGSSGATDTVDFWPAGGLRAFCTRKVSVGSTGSAVRRFLWHGIGGSDYVGGNQKWRHMYKEFPISVSSVGYSESAVGLRILGNTLSGQGVNASTLFGHFYSRRGLGSSTSNFENSYGQLNFRRTGRNNWMMGWSGIPAGSGSIIGQYKQACVDLGLDPGPIYTPSIQVGEDPPEYITGADAMNLMNDRAGAPGGAPRKRTMGGTSGMAGKEGNNNGQHQLKSIKPGSELNNPLNFYSDLASAASTAAADNFVGFWVATPKIYNNNLVAKVKDPGWKYYSDKRAGVFAIPTGDLSNASPEEVYASKIEFLNRINAEKNCHFKKHVPGIGYTGAKSARVSIDTEIMQTFVLDPLQTTIKLVFITDWGQAATCRQAAASLGLAD